MIIKNQLIARPTDQGDGLCLWRGDVYVVENCFIDLSACALDDIDEALSVTYGSSAEIRNCLIRGAGKLVLCGCGDEEIAPREKGRRVKFTHCILEDFGRRGPEVQDGMIVELESCIIRNWGSPSRFTVRSFGAWAHGEGSMITATDCIFIQENGRFGKHWFKDLIGHVGQAWNDRKFAGLFSKDAWRPGNCRGLTASDGGTVRAVNCFASSGVVLENAQGEMDAARYNTLMAELETMKWSLYETY